MWTLPRRAVGVSMTVLVLAIAFGLATGPPALAHGGGGGGGHGGGGHGGGGHSGGHSGGYSGGHYSSGHHTGTYHQGGYHHGYWPGYYGGLGYFGFYPGYGYGYYGNGGYGYPYSSGYGYSYPGYVDPTAPVVSAAAPSPLPSRYLGIDEQAVDDGGVLGMQVLRIYPGSPAERAGLQVGDVILSANGYLTQQHGNLTWIISGLPADGALQMDVHSASDGMRRAIVATIP